MSNIIALNVYDYLGKIAYKNFNNAARNQPNATAIPKWDDLPDEVKHAWIMAAISVANECHWHIQDIIIDNERAANV